MQKHNWTKSDDDFFRTNYLDLGPTKCGNSLVVTPFMATYRARQLGIVPTPEKRLVIKGPREIPDRIRAKLGFYDILQDATLIK